MTRREFAELPAKYLFPVWLRRPRLVFWPEDSAFDGHSLARVAAACEEYAAARRRRDVPGIQRALRRLRVIHRARVARSLGFSFAGCEVAGVPVVSVWDEDAALYGF